MNEQQLADLFSEQIDRMLEGGTLETHSDVDDLQDLLELGNQISHTQFQASAAAQLAFHSQLAAWFGLANGGSPMTILGLTKVWFISIIVAVMVGAGSLIVIVSSIFIFSGDEIVEAPTVTVSATVEGTPTPEASTTAVPDETTTATVSPEASPSVEPSTTPEAPPTDEPPTFIFISNLTVIALCQGAYTTQTTLVNYGDLPISDAALAWEVIEGVEFVDRVSLNGDDLAEAFTEEINVADTLALPGVDSSPASTTNETPVMHDNYAALSSISVDQEINLDVKVKVNDNWWEQPDGAKIKVKLSVKNKVEISAEDDYSDRDRGHGNDPDGIDEDNPGRGQGRRGDGDHDNSNDGHSDFSSYSQIITIVKQGAQWITLTGVVQPHGDQSWLVDGVVVVINECTGLPLDLVPGANVEVIGILQPDGSFVAINIIIVDVNVTVIDFDSGVPMPGDDNDDDGGGGGKKGDGKKGGSKKGGSKKGGS